ncbi:MAG TPA: tetratricopeptide repeat protein [Trueperaceae bacterium]
MTVQKQSEGASPWRKLFEEVRRAAANRRDELGVQGSINWLRQQMERRGANPNVVRNIIYRDKGRPADKRALFEILAQLWEECGQGKLSAPEIEVLLAHGKGAESDAVALLGREKRRAYREFVGGVRSGVFPKLLVTGRPGSGKTLLIDYIQEALEAAPKAADRIVRLEFGAGHLATSLTRLALSVGVPAEVIESKLVKVGSSGAYAVQADAQAEVARVILEAVRASETPTVLLAHVSRTSAQEERLGSTLLRLNTPEVPRVSAAEWLWMSLFDPLSRLPSVALLVSMSDVPARAMASLGAFDEPIRLSPPTASEARRYVRSRLPNLDPRQQEAVVRRAGRSFEELRTLTLLAQVRGPTGADPVEDVNSQHVAQLASLVVSAGDERLRDFLAALAALSLAEFPTFTAASLESVRQDTAEPNAIELAFLDPVPPAPDRYRPFSREFARLLRQTLLENDPERFRSYSRRAADFFHPGISSADPAEAAHRHLHHLFDARDWPALAERIDDGGLQQSLVRPLWEAARSELGRGELFENVAYQVAAHFVRLGAHDHPKSQQAFAELEKSASEQLRSWAFIQRAEGAVLRGQVDTATELLERCPGSGDDLREAEAALVRASISRWRSDLDEAARYVEEVARPRLTRAAGAGRAVRVAKAKAAVWAGLIAKDRGDLETALREFDSVARGDELIEARVAFQRGDVLLALGRFDAALEALDEAVRLARLSDALTSEQTRYLSRRATLHRKRGSLELARADFEAARAIIRAGDEWASEQERAFWLARSENERALLLMAEGDHQGAIHLLEANMHTFETFGERLRVDSSYRVLRGTLRLGRAYLFRALGQPYRLPYLRNVDEVPEGADLRHARALVASVRDAIDKRGSGRLHWPLRRDTRILTSLLCGDPSKAVAQARCALSEARFPYQIAESRAHIALALLRSGDAIAALEEVAMGQTALAGLVDEHEASDVGLRSWLTGLEIEASLVSGDVERAARALAIVLRDDQYRPYQQTLLRMFGEAVEESGKSQVLSSSELRPILHLNGELSSGRVRLPDALSAWWQGQESVAGH